MRAYASCIRPLGGSAMVIPANRSAPERWELPPEAIDVMIEHPSYEVIDAKKFLKTRKMKPMWSGASLKAKEIYFLVPANSEQDSARDDNDLLVQIMSLKKLLGRGGTKRIVVLEPGVGTYINNEFRI